MQTMKKVLQGGWEFWPYVRPDEVWRSEPLVPMSAQSDWALQEIIGGFLDGGPESLRKAAAEEFLSRYPDDISRQGHKTWAVYAQTKAKKLLC